jgi:hypothetical protein
MSAAAHHNQALARLIDAAVDRLDCRAVRQDLVRPSLLAGLGPTTAATLNTTFSAGLVRIFITQGGWAPIRRPGDAQDLRLWERYPDYPLSFSPYSQQLLTALLVQPVLDGEQQLPHRVKLTLGDQLTLFLAARLLFRAGLGEGIGLHSCFEASALCRIGFPQYIETDALDLSAWASPAGLCTLEGLQGPLGQCVLEAERVKMSSILDEAMIRIGSAQNVTARALLDFVHQAGREDLGDLYLRTIETLVREHHHGRDWIGQLGVPRSIGERSRAAGAASSTLRLIEIFANWYSRAQSTSFLDDDYAHQQTLLSKWEQRLPTLLPVVEERLRELDPLAVVAHLLRN